LAPNTNFKAVKILVAKIFPHQIKLSQGFSLNLIATCRSDDDLEVGERQGLLA
jgi:hypothetical protein